MFHYRRRTLWHRFINAVLKCGELIRASCFERESRVYWYFKMYRNIKWQMKGWGGGISSWSEGGLFGSPPLESSNNTGGDTWVPAGDVKNPHIEDLILLQSLLTNRNSYDSLSSCCSLLVQSQCLQTPWCKLRWGKTLQLVLKPSWSFPDTRCSGSSALWRTLYLRISARF
jgi:hypothetical protein